MIFPTKYKILNKNKFANGDYSLVPIRYNDRLDIMQWRNEQIHHLRQTNPLTQEEQDNYFEKIVSKLFKVEKPDQLLFSYLKNNQCIGYGGLVHINWVDMNAEISFIMKTELEKKEFKKHWGIYLDLIEKVAFHQLRLHKIYTYAFDLRQNLYDAVEDKNYYKEAVLKEHCFFEGKYIDVIIHSKINEPIKIRKLESRDKEITFIWANDHETRKNSFNSESIVYEEHSVWFQSKLNNDNAHYYICEVNDEPAGLVRFDRDDRNNAYIIGITLDQKFRGKKLSAKFLTLSCDTFSKNYKEKIIAYIKKTNIASIKAFEKVGFQYHSKKYIDGFESLKYEYKT